MRPTVVVLVQQEMAGWQPGYGLCPACVEHFAGRLSAQRSRESLHTATEPHTTFPYYHPVEETVLSQPERLADYHTVGGRGVTIAFLDSGYYPHPDLAARPDWPAPTPAWTHQTPAQLRRTLEGMELRLVEYVDLDEEGEQVGLHLTSLWDGAGYSWHGQMTTTLAAGNGHLSGGHFRGYAPQSQLLPIKIGRRNGRIPEADILAGLQWLLRDDNWLHYNVRVVNVAVGGDFDEPWRKNPVCLAAEELSARGVLICAAAGNSGRAVLYAPAQAPSVLTVGGYEDHNRRWDGAKPAAVAAVDLYHHNFGRVHSGAGWLPKPELLALARYVPAPILPPSPIFQEMYTLGELRRALLENRPPGAPHPVKDGLVDEWMFDVWEAVRKRMNAHKWVHPFYQHVDGTSVAVAQVAAVTAQMFAANPNLSGQEVKALLLATALPLPQGPAPFSGHGILQPTLAVAAALRAHNGPLVGYPQSGTQPDAGELQKWLSQGKVTVADIVNPAAAGDQRPLYFGLLAPSAQAVSMVGLADDWHPHHLSLRRALGGWWHGLVQLPPGRHTYRFWVEYGPEQPPAWCADPENPLRCESGYWDDHSFIDVRA
jgi:serine protease AprX